MTDAELQRLLVLDAGPGPALAIDAADADAIIDAALAGAGFGPGGGSGGSRGSGGRNGGGGGSGAGTSGGAAVGTKLATVAGAAIVVVAIVLFVGRDRSRGHEQTAAPIPDAAIIDAAVGGIAVAPVESDAEIDDEAIEPIDEDAIEISDPTPPKRAQKPTARRESPADLLGEANAKRAAKQWRESDALYARVVEVAPRSLAAQTALIASASLRLEHLNDPKGAMQRFKRALALAPSGALAEDARWGLAEAAHAIHDRTAEAAALDDFLTHHASSPLAPRAKARRAELP